MDFYRIICLLFITGLSHGQSVPHLNLLDGNKIPVVGLDTFLVPEHQVDIAVTSALENGYRHFDTAHSYKNKTAMANALKKWFSNGGKREDLFISSKLPATAMRASDVAEVLELSLKKLGLDYFDMYLIHLPVGMQKTSDYHFPKYENGTYAWDYSTDLLAIWKELENQVKIGKVKSLGVSNFNKTQLIKLWTNAQIKPTNLQIELNPYIQQNELVDLCHDLGVVVTAYNPLGSGSLTRLTREEKTVELQPLIKHDVVLAIAEKYNKTPAQVLLRFTLQRNVVIITKSTNPETIKEHIDVFDFMLSKNEINQLKELDMHGEYRKFDLLSFVGIEHHPEYPFYDKLSKLA